MNFGYISTTTTSTTISTTNHLLATRSIIDDIGSAVNGAAHMSGLVRSKQGPFRLADCLTEDQWNFDSLRRHIVKCTEIVDPLPPIDKRKLEWRRLENQ